MLEVPPISKSRALGLDLVEMARFEQAVDRHGARLLHRLFHEEELRYCQVGSPATRLHRLAGRFAAKEAVFKALGGSLYRWHDILVGRTPLGRPTISLNGRAAERSHALGVQHWQVSISHTRQTAAAVAIGD